jgi:hypothetical protein
MDDLNIKDSERDTIINEGNIPHCSMKNTNVSEPNAYIHVDEFGRIGIFPIGGGWIGSKIGNFQGDLAPFSG